MGWHIGMIEVRVADDDDQSRDLQAVKNETKTATSEIVSQLINCMVFHVFIHLLMNIVRENFTWTRTVVVETHANDANTFQF